LEFENHRPLYDWFLKALDIKMPPRQIEFARMNVNYTLTSKRKCLKLVQDKLVNGWDDPRMATLCGMRRRGYPAEAVKDFVSKVGVSKAYSVIDFALFESCVRDYLNQNADRAMAVLRPLKVIVDNYAEGKTEELEVEINPNKPELGNKTVTFSKEIYIEQDDFMLDPPGKYFRLCPTKEVRLKGAYFIKYASHETDENGNITAVHCTYDPETKGGDAPDGRKVKGTLHWISAKTAKKATVRLYDRLFLVENPSDEEGVSSFAENLNPESLQIIENALIESDVANAKPGEVFQFMRQGYFTIDTDSTMDNIIINRTVALKDSFSVKK
jgi:glutaminyl-tRNA synthetase